MTFAIARSFLCKTIIAGALGLLLNARTSPVEAKSTFLATHNRLPPAGKGLELGGGDWGGAALWSEASDDDGRVLIGRGIVVPDDYKNLRDAMESAPQAREIVSIRPGVHVHFGEYCDLRPGGHACVEGEAGSEVWGAWWIFDCGRLDAKHLYTCVHANLSQDATLEVWGGRCDLQHCSIRSVGGVGVNTMLGSRVVMRNSSVGGLNTATRRAQVCVCVRACVCACVRACVRDGGCRTLSKNPDAFQLKEEPHEKF